MKIAILHDAVTAGSRPDEIDALRQAELVDGVLIGMGHSVTTAAVSLDLEALSSRLLQCAPDLVFNLVESLAGYGRLIHVVPALLEASGVPFTGSGSSACLLTTDKPLAKAWLHVNRMPTPAWHCRRAPALLELTPPCACIVKPEWEDASVGIDDNAVRHIADGRELDDALRAASARFGDVFAERYVQGREFNLSLLADGDLVEVLPIAEIEFVDYPADKPRIVGYPAKWSEGSFEFAATPRRYEFADSDETLLRHLKNLALKCWNRFGLRGYARVDFRVDESDQPWILEINVNPCLSPDAGLMAAARRRGLAAGEVVERILAAAITSPAREKAAPHV